MFCSIVAAWAVQKRNEDTKIIPSETRGQPATALQDIRGFWLVERFEEFQPSWRNDTPWRSAYVQIGDEHLTYSVGCNQSGNPASLGPDSILKDVGDGSRIQTLIGCDAVREARDGRFFAFFGSGPDVRKLDEDRIVLKSDERELVLVRPNRWRRTHKPDLSEIEGRWVPQVATTYNGAGWSSFGLSDKPGVVSIQRERVVWSRCPELPIPVRWTKDAQLAVTAPINVHECPTVARATSSGPETIMEMLATNPAVIRIGPDRIALIVGSGENGRQMDLQKEENVERPPAPPPTPVGSRTPSPPSAPPTNR